jgi:hypothetical protein
MYLEKKSCMEDYCEDGAGLGMKQGTWDDARSKMGMLEGEKKMRGG